MRILSIILIIPLIFCYCGSDETPAEIPHYEIVEGWPELPENITLGQTPGVAVDAEDNVYVLHRGEHPILCFTREGKFIRSFGDEHVSNAGHGLEIAPDNTVWVTDLQHHTLMQFTPEGELLRTLGTKGEPGESEKNFDKPTDLVFTDDGDFYVTDGYGNSRVVKFSKDYQFLKAWGVKGTGQSEFDTPHSTAIDSKGRVYVCDRENSRMQIFTPEGEFIDMWTHIGQPWGIFITRNSLAVVVDGKNMKAALLTLQGEIISTWDITSSPPGLHHIAVDSHDDLYITEINPQRIQKFRKVK